MTSERQRSEAFLGGSGACSPRKILWFSQAQIFILGHFGALFLEFSTMLLVRKRCKDTQIILFLFIYFHHLSLHFVTFITTMVYRGPQSNFH